MSDSGATYKIDVSKAVGKLRTASRQFDPTSLLKAIGAQQLKWVVRNFATDGGNVGGWKPLSPFTIAHRSHGGARPLQDTGVSLKNTFNWKLLGNGAVRVGTPTHFASFHDKGVKHPIYPKTAKALGARLPGGKSWALKHTSGIPQRRMLPTAEEGKKLALEVIEAALRNVRKSDG